MIDGFCCAFQSVSLSTFALFVCVRSQRRRNPHNTFLHNNNKTTQQKSNNKSILFLHVVLFLFFSFTPSQDFIMRLQPIRRPLVRLLMSRMARCIKRNCRLGLPTMLMPAGRRANSSIDVNWNNILLLKLKLVQYTFLLFAFQSFPVNKNLPIIQRKRSYNTRKQRKNWGNTYDTQ